MTHEILQAFEAQGLPLCRTLAEMLGEHPSHQTERRGCGLTQATRFLAERINRPRDPLSAEDLSVFAERATRATEAVARRCVELGWPQGWRNLEHAPAQVRAGIAGMPEADDLLALQPRIAKVREQVRHVESRLLLDMLSDLLAAREPMAPALPVMQVKPEIGSCSQTEEFFLEIAHGKIRRGGAVNIIVDPRGRPVLVEKMGLGESHSALAIAPVDLCNVRIPPGGLFALRYADAADALAVHAHGKVLAIAVIEQARFLRLTTLAVPPRDRERAFSTQFHRQMLGNFVSPHSTTLDDLEAFATARLAGTRA